MSEIPLVDLSAQHREIAAEVEEGFVEVVSATAFVAGERVGTFERQFAAFCDVRHCVGVANGTDALELALRACGVGRGDEVVLPANTFIATAEAVARAGADPVLVDCDPETLLIDVDQALARVGHRTAAVVPVHLFGQMAPVERLVSVTESTRVVMVEDAAQCHGASRHGRQPGSLGPAAATSFYPGKNLGAYGDGGAVLTDDDEVARRVRSLGNHGGLDRYRHAVLGCNSRLDTLQAVVLGAKLARLASWNEARRAAAERYDELLRGLPDVVLPTTLAGNTHVWHLYVVRVPRRDEVLARLREDGIGAAVHYPVPLHLQDALGHLGHRRGDFPVAEAAARSMISLPIFPHITPAEQERVADVLAKALA